MNKLLLFLALTLFAGWTSIAQTPDASQEAKLLGLIKEVEAQQAQLAANQVKIEEKLATVTEAVRTARIYTKRER